MADDGVDGDDGGVRVVDDAHQGRGIASTLVRAALDDVVAGGGRFVACCPDVAGWVQRHPEHQVHQA